MSTEIQKKGSRSYEVIFGYVKQDFMTPELEELAQKYHNYVTKNKKGVIERLEDLVQKYPAVPAFKNYLSIAYQQNDMPDKFEAMVFQTLEAHPDYSFAKFQLIIYYIETNNMSKLNEIFENVSDIIDFFPDKSQFHISEVIAFHEGYLSYLVKKRKFSEVADRLKNLRILVARDKDSLKKITTLELILDNRRIEESINFFSQQNKRIVEATFKDFFGQTDTAPIFHHQEIELFYQKGFDIGEEAIKEVLSLPQDTLIEDLEGVLVDVQRRFMYFLKNHNEKVESDENEESDESTIFMPFHTIFFLAELKSVKSLDTIFNLFRQDITFYEFWFGDFFGDITIPLYQLAQDNLKFLADYLKEENILTEFRMVASKIVSQVALHQPERRNEVLAWYRELLEYYIAHKDNEGLIDSNLIGWMCSDVLNFQGIELLDVIQKLFEASIIDEFICGDYEAIKKELDEPTFSSYNSIKLQVDLNIYQLYEKIDTNESLNLPDTEEDMLMRQKEIESFKFIPLFSHRNSFGDFEEDEEEIDDLIILDKPKNNQLKPKFNYGRNDKITVQYQDGKVIKDVKFKKVEDDLISGKCKVLE